VAHSAFLPYLGDPAPFVERLHEVARTRPLWWVSGEFHGYVPGVDGPNGLDRPGMTFTYGVVALDGSGEATTIAHGASHGSWLHWHDATARRRIGP
jgi:hypothetical protein